MNATSILAKSNASAFPPKTRLFEPLNNEVHRRAASFIDPSKIHRNVKLHRVDEPIAALWEVSEKQLRALRKEFLPSDYKAYKISGAGTVIRID